MANKAVVDATIQFIEANLHRRLTLDIISAQAGYSKYHLNRMFAGQTGKTLHQYLQASRLQAAAARLQTESTPIIEIALDVGYQSQQAFSLAFKQRYGCAPQFYRQRANNAPNLQFASCGTVGQAA